jgi:hypothetical protein
VHELKLKSHDEWRSYCKSGKKPEDIPANPLQVYGKEWKGFGDWLGTGTIASYNIKFRPYAEAKKIVHPLRIKNLAEWRKYCKSGKKPQDIPAYPDHVYEKDWKGWGDWLGLDVIIYRGTRYAPFEEAKKVVHKLGIENQDEWWAYCNSTKPGNIPSYPNIVYKEHWKGWGDWLGKGTTVDNDKIYRPFADAKEFVQSLKLKDVNEWTKYWKSGKPRDIPSYPKMTYRDQWSGWRDWLGINYISYEKKEHRSFEEARRFVHGLGIKTREDWKYYCKSGKKPLDIPANPNRTYEKDWNGWGDWLGTGTIASFDKKFRPFEDARQFSHKLGLISQAEWGKYCKSGKKPDDIPSNPNLSYEKEWKGFGDWLGTGSVAAQNRVYKSFDEAKKFVHSLGLKSVAEWDDYCKSGKKPSDIPTSPSRPYKEHWKGWGDWLGYENPEWVVRRVKELLQDLIKSGIIYQWNEAVLYSFLLRKGVLNLEASNRHNSTSIYYSTSIQI